MRKFAPNIHWLAFVVAVFFVLPTMAEGANVLTFENWKSLSADDQEALIDGVDIEKYSNLNLIEISESGALSLVSDPAVRAFAEKMDSFMKANSNFEIEDEHSRVGDVDLRFLTVLLLDGRAVGGAVGYFQQGCDLEEDNYQYFDTREEAIAAGCDVDADVSWQAHGVFNHELEPYRYDSYMEWTGY